MENLSRFVKSYWELDKLKTNVRLEILGGLTTFITMAYIIIVNPKILEAAGIPLGPSMVATILTAFLGTFLMGVYAKRPFAIAPYMGENAFVAYSLVKGMGYSWQVVLGAVFISAVIFALLTVLRVRGWPGSGDSSFAQNRLYGGYRLFSGFYWLERNRLGDVGCARCAWGT